MNKKYLLTLITASLIAFAVLVVPGLVLAQDATPSVKPTISTRAGQIKDKVKEELLTRVRRAVSARVEVFNRAINRSETLLNRIQIRIDKAKAAGKDTTEIEKLMADARLKLSDARVKLSEISAEKNTAVDKAGYAAIKTKFKVVWNDLQTVWKDASKMTSLLKGFNSATSSGNNPQQGTNAAKLRNVTPTTVSTNSAH